MPLGNVMIRDKLFKCLYYINCLVVLGGFRNWRGWGVLCFVLFFPKASQTNTKRKKTLAWFPRIFPGDCLSWKFRMTNAVLASRRLTCKNSLASAPRRVVPSLLRGSGESSCSSHLRLSLGCQTASRELVSLAEPPQRETLQLKEVATTSLSMLYLYGWPVGSMFS